MTLAATTVILYPVYHPAAALYTPSMLKALEDDFARLPGLLGRPDTARGVATLGPPAPTRPARARRRARRVPPRRSARPLLSRARAVTSSAAETEAFGGALAALLRPGDVVFLRRRSRRGQDDARAGCLQGARDRGAGDEPDFHDRPSLPGTATVAHLDLYRFVGFSAAEWGDLEPYFDGTIAFVEWPEAGVAALPAARVSLVLGHVEPDERRISVDSPDRTLLEDLARADPRVRHRN